MFRFEFDRPSVIAVGIFSGPDNSDADFQAYIESFEVLDRIAYDEARERGVYTVVVDPENPRPSALWRKRIADASAHLRSNPLVTLVSQSAAIRSVVTAINWFRPPPYSIKCHDSIEASAAWIQSQRAGNALEIMRRLEQACRGAAVMNAAPQSRRNGNVSTNLR